MCVYCLYLLHIYKYTYMHIYLRKICYKLNILIYTIHYMNINVVSKYVLYVCVLYIHPYIIKKKKKKLGCD